MTWLAVLALLSLFSGIEERVSGIVLRPFDFIAALMTALLVYKVLARANIRIPTGYLLLLPFVFVHVLSAMMVGQSNGIREGLQACVLMAFLLALCNADDPAPRGAKWWVLFCGTWAFLAFNVGWHINEGHYSGWKRLDELKHAFSVATLLTMVWIAMRNFRPSFLQLALFGLLGGLILISGERKALLIYILSLLLILIGMRSSKAVVALIAPIVCIAAASVFFIDDYVLRQLSSFAFETGYSPAGAPISFSNEQRIFAFKAGMELFSQHPFFGVGTNRYQMLVNRFFSYYPPFLRTSIHGEFFRILVENGLVGLSTYVLIWIAAIHRTLRFLRYMKLTGEMDAPARKAYLFSFVIFYITALIICGLEASGSEAFLFMALVSLWPDISRITMRRQRSQAHQTGALALSRV